MSRPPRKPKIALPDSFTAFDYPRVCRPEIGLTLAEQGGGPRLAVADNTPRFQRTANTPRELTAVVVYAQFISSIQIKIWTDLSSVLSQFTRLTDRQTNRRTDSFLIPIPCLHSMQRGKNCSGRPAYIVCRRHSILQLSFF